MAIILLQICDRHPEIDRVEGTTITVTVDGKTVESELCAECKRPMLEAFALLLEHGREVKGGSQPSSAPTARVPVRRGPQTFAQHPVTRQPTLAEHEANDDGTWPCGYCDRDLETQSGRGIHRQRAHGIRSPNAAKRPQHHCPFCEQVDQKPHRIRTHVAVSHPERLAEFDGMKSAGTLPEMTHVSESELTAVG